MTLAIFTLLPIHNWLNSDSVRFVHASYFWTFQMLEYQSYKVWTILSDLCRVYGKCCGEVRLWLHSMKPYAPSRLVMEFLQWICYNAVFRWIHWLFFFLSFSFLNLQKYTQTPKISQGQFWFYFSQKAALDFDLWFKSPFLQVTVTALFLFI